MKSKQSNEPIYDVMHRINIDVLKKGDIIFTTTEDIFPSGVIKTFTNSDISHAMLCVSRGSIIDATKDCVQARNPEKMFYPLNCPIHIFRYREEISSEKLDKIINYVRDKVGTRYSSVEAVQAKVKVHKKTSQKQFCSRLVAQAYASVGINLVDDPFFCTPEELKQSKLLVSVKNTSVKIEKNEIISSIEHGNSTDQMIKATNNLLNELRFIDSSIETINHIYSVVIDHPDKDKEIAKILIDSGYLDVFDKYELEKYPWRYNLAEMQKIYDTCMLQHYCQELLNREKNGDFNHWKTSLSNIEKWLKKFPRETIKLFFDLYQKQIFYHDKRIEIAECFLKNNL